MFTKYKNIRISEETYNKLTTLGDLKDSFDSVIKNLLNRQEEEPI